MDGQLSAMLRSFYEKKDAHHRLKAESDAATNEYRAGEQDVLDRMDELGLKTLTVDLPGIGSVRFTRRKPTVYGRVTDLDAAMDSFENSGRVDELFAPKVSPARLNEFVRECLEQGQPLPPGVDFYERPGITVSRN
jgi:hypothetical protein